MTKTNYNFSFVAFFLLLFMGQSFLYGFSTNQHGKSSDSATPSPILNGYRSSTLTVADGASTNSYIPVYGLYLDESQRSQVIYAENLLTAMQGKQIEKITFYTSNDPAAWQGTITVSLATTTTADLSSGFLTANFTDIYVGRLSVVNREMVITFSSPFIYNSGNLLIQFDQPIGGNYSSGYFYGITATSTGRLAYGSSYSGSGTGYSFLPKTTFEYDNVASCPKPASLRAINTGSSSVVCTWIENGSATNWQLEYGARGFANGTGTFQATTNDTATISGLTPQTDYDIYVRTICGVGDTSNWVGPLSITTSQIAGIVPYTADFEDIAENAMWGFARNTNLSYPNNWYIDTAQHYGGTKSLYISNNTGRTNAYTTASAPCAVWAYRDIYFTPAGEFELSFDWQAIGQTTVDYMKVFIGPPTNVTASTSTTVTIPTSITALTNPLNNTTYFNAWDGTNNSYTSWNHFSKVFPQSYSGTTQRIYFLWVNNDLNGTQPPAAIDNLSVIGKNCTTPSNLYATNINSNGATVNWTIMNNENVFELVYSTQSDFNPDTITPITITDTNVAILTNLSPKTNYWVSVRAVCGTEYSFWSSVFVFSTAQLAATLPYNCDFEDALERNNWDLINSTAINKWYVGNAVNNTPQGSYSVYISANGTSHTYTTGAVTIWAYRDINFNVQGDYQLDFDWIGKAESTWDFMRIFIDDIVPVVATTTNSRPIDPPSTNSMILQPTPQTNSSDNTYFNLSETWQHYHGVLPASFYGTTKRIYFAWTNDGSGTYDPPVAVDNITINVNTCLSVTNVIIPDSTITTNSITVHWTDNGGGSAWILEYKLNNDTTWTAIAVSTNPYTVTGLQPASNYNFRMKTDCGGGNTSFYTPVSNFQTHCDIISTFPWSYGFEDTWETVIPNAIAPRCWYNIDLLSTYYLWEPNSSDGIGGSKCAYFYGTTSTTTAYNDYLITPYLALTGNEQLRFSIKNYSSSYSPKLSIIGLASQTSTIGSTIRTITVNHDTYQEYTINLSAFQGDYCIAFARKDSGQYHLYLDNVVIEEIPACPRPMDIVISNILNDSARISWTAAPGATNYQIVYSTQPQFNPDTATPITITGTLYYFSYLQPTTTYYFYMRSNCGSDFSDWTNIISFTTGQIPGRLPYLCDFENTSENQNWQFANSAGLNIWTIGNATNNTINGNNAAYVSSDNGLSNTYTGSAVTIWAYRDIYFDRQGYYYLDFDWNSKGESSWDFMSIFIGDIVSIEGTTANSRPISAPLGSNAITLTPTPVINTSFPTYFNLSSSWQHYSGTLPQSYYGQIKRIYFAWTNDGSGLYDPPAAIDNLNIAAYACLPVTNLNVPAASITANSAVINWTASGTETSWFVEYKEIHDASWTIINILNNPTCTLTNLSPATSYIIRVQTDCGNGEGSAYQTTTFNTNQLPANLPYSCNFENATENQNWQFANLSNKWAIGTQTYNSPTKSLYVTSDGVNYGYNHNSSSIWAYRDISFPSGNQFILSFDWKGVGEVIGSTFYDYMRVYIGDIMNVEGVLVANGPIGATNLGGSLANQTNWTTYSTTLNATYANTTKRLYFGWREDSGGSSGVPAAVDNIQISVFTCPGVTNILVPSDSITPTSVYVSWTPGGTETQWIVEYKAASDAQWTVVNVSTNPNIRLTNLLPSTAYMVRVKANCGGGDESVFSSTVNFNSGCGVITTLPWTYQFESTWVTSGTRTAPYCWKNIDNNLTSYYWRYNTNMGMGSSGCAYYYGISSTTTQNNAWLITPEISLSGNEQVVFFAKNYSASYSPIISVYVLTNQTDTMSGTRVGVFTVNTNNYTEYTVDLSNYTGNYSLAFVRRDKGNEGLYLDNITVEARPSCPKPSNLQLTNVGSTNASFSWIMGNASPQGYEISYSTTAGFHPDTSSLRIFVTGSDTFYTIPVGTLSPTTTYYLYLRAICGNNDTSDWNYSPITFTTSQIPGTLPYLCDFENETERNNWQVANSTNTNKWYIGTATNNTPSGSYSAYISGNNGVANTYTTSSVTVWAYRDIYFDVTGEYILSFDWKSKGESSYDFMRVFIGNIASVVGTNSNTSSIPAPTGSNALILTPTPVTNTSYPTFFNLSDTWQHYTGTLSTSYAGTTKRIYFAWTNDASLSNDPPAAIDNIMIDVNPCISVSNVIVPDTSITDHSAWIFWTPASPTDTVWSLEYKTDLAQTWTVVQITGTPEIHFTNLTPSTNYLVRIRTDCGGGDYSFYSPTTMFSTPQIPVNVPYICGFEDATENNNWQFTNNSSSTTPNWYIGAAVHNSGDSSLYISDNGGINNNYSGSGCIVWAFRDIYFTPAGEYTFSFDWKCYGESTYDYMMAFIGDPKNVVAVNTSTTVTVPQGAVTLINDLRTSNQTYFNGYDGSGYNNITWNRYNSLLDGTYSGKTKRIYFAWRNDISGEYQPPIAIDNISITPVSCARPLYLAVVHADTNSVTLNWQPASDETNFEIVLGTTSNFIIDTATIRFFVSDTVLTIPNLNPNTSYYIYIRSLCGENTTSNWSSIFPFMTTQSPLVIPFVCDFEDPSETINWGIANNANTSYPNGWFVGNAANNGGTHSLYISNNNGTQNAYSINSCRVWAYRDIYFDTQGDYELSFDWKCYGESTYDYMMAFIGTPAVISAATTNTVETPLGADTILNSLTGLHRFNAYSGSAYVNTSWNTETIRLQDCFGTTKRLYFEWINDASVANQPPIAIDNIIGNVNSCLAVTNVNIPENLISTDSVVVEWTSRGDETSWIIEYKLSSSNTWTTINVTENPYNLTGLMSSSTYQLRIKADCGGGSSSFYTDIVNFNTLCGIIDNFPWRYNFEEAWVPVGNRTAPNCWNNIDNGATSYYWRENATNGVNNSGCAYYYGTSSTSTTNDATLITPELLLTGNEQVSFYAKNYSSSYSPIISIYALSDPNNLASGTLVSTFTVSSNTHQEFVADLSAYVGHFYIGFARKDNGNEGLYLDNVIVEPIPTCKKPISVTVTNSSDSYATINWVSSETSPLGYEIAISTDPNFNPDTCTTTFIAGDTNSYTLPAGSLEPSHTYYVYVRTICTSADTSIWNNIAASFGTSQLTLNVPFLVDFEDADESASWQFYQGVNSWTIGTSTSESPNHSLYVTGDGSTYGTYNITTTCDIWAYRDIKFPEHGDQFTLSFDWKSVGELIGSYSYDYMRVYIGNIQNVTGVLVSSGPAGASSLGGTFIDQSAWTNFTTTLAGSYAGTTKRLYFGWRNDGSGSYGPPAAVDNIEIIVNCSPPSAIYVFDVNDISADLTWTGTETNYNLEYGPRGFTQGSGTLIHVTGTSYTITGLTPETQYTVYIQADCGDDNTSEWLPYDFATTPTSINDLDLEQQVTIYPNPVNDLLQIETNIPFERFEILNYIGQIVDKNSITDNNFAINVKHYSSGVYFIKLIGNEGVVIRKFVKE